MKDFTIWNRSEIALFLRLSSGGNSSLERGMGIGMGGMGGCGGAQHGHRAISVATKSGHKLMDGPRTLGHGHGGGHSGHSHHHHSDRSGHSSDKAYGSLEYRSYDDNQQLAPGAVRRVPALSQLRVRVSFRPRGGTSACSLARSLARHLQRD